MKGGAGEAFEPAPLVGAPSARLVNKDYFLLSVFFIHYLR